MPGERHADRGTALLAAGLAGGLQLALTFPAPDWLDSPALITAGLHLAPFHPPGSPLAVLAAHALSLWPWSPPHQTLLAFSALWAALAVYLLVRLGQAVWSSLGPDDRPGRLAVVPALGLAFGLGPGLMSQAVRTEVYTLGLVLSLAATGCLLRMALSRSLGPPDSGSGLDRACALMGMGLAVHPPMALAPLPGLLLLSLTRRWRPWFYRPARLGRSAAFGLVGAAPLLLLPLMISSWQDLRWGDPRSLTGLLEYLSGATFAHTFSQPVMALGAKGLKLTAVLILGLGWGLGLLAVLGAWLVGRTRPLAAGLLIGVGLATAPFLLLQRSIRLDNPDVTGYALPALAALALLAIGALAVIARSLAPLGPKWRPLLPGLAIGLLAISALGLPTHDHSACGRSQAALRADLQALPKGATVLAADFNLAFMLDYLIRSEGLRQDVVSLYLRDLDNPGLRRALARDHAELAAGLPASAQVGPADLARLASVAPLATDLGPHLPEGPGHPSTPLGFLWLLAAPGAAAETGIAERLMLGSNCPPRRDPRAADVITWHATWQARAAAAEGRLALARERIQLAACASPQDRQVNATLSGLGLGRPECEAGPALSPVRTSPYRPPTARALVLLAGLFLWTVGLLSPALRGRAGGLRLPMGLAGGLLMALALSI